MAKNKGSRKNLKAGLVREKVQQRKVNKSIDTNIPAWDNFMAMHVGIQNGIAMHQRYLGILEDKSIILNIPDTAGTVNAIKSLNGGLVKLQTDLNKTGSKHFNKSGNCSMEDFDLFQTIYAEYDQLRGYYQEHVEPHANFIVEQISAAEKILESSMAAEGITSDIKESIIADSEDDATTDQETI